MNLQERCANIIPRIVEPVNSEKEGVSLNLASGGNSDTVHDEAVQMGSSTESPFACTTKPHIWVQELVPAP